MYIHIYIQGNGTQNKCSNTKKTKVSMQKPIFGRTVNQVSSSLSKIIVRVWFLTTKIFYNKISHQLCTVKLDGLNEYEFY